MNGEYPSIGEAQTGTEVQSMTGAGNFFPPAPMADEIREHLATTQKGQTANTIGNCVIVFRADSMLRGVIRLNLRQSGWTLYGIWAGAG